MYKKMLLLSTLITFTLGAGDSVFSMDDGGSLKRPRDVSTDRVDQYLIKKKKVAKIDIQESKKNRKKLQEIFFNFPQELQDDMITELVKYEKEFSSVLKTNSRVVQYPGPFAQKIKINFPKTWDMSDPDFVGKITVVKNSSEYFDVIRYIPFNGVQPYTYTAEGKTYVVDKIERIQNPYLYIQSCLYKWQILCESPELDPSCISKFLFHASNTNFLLNTIREGLDPRITKLNGSIGAGVYFSSLGAVFAYTILSQPLVVLADVAIGITTQGKVGLRRPRQGTHSTHGWTDDGREMFSVFDTHASYSHYAITLTEILNPEVPSLTMKRLSALTIPTMLYALNSKDKWKLFNFSINEVDQRNKRSESYKMSITSDNPPYWVPQKEVGQIFDVDLSSEEAGFVMDTYLSGVIPDEFKLIHLKRFQNPVLHTLYTCTTNLILQQCQQTREDGEKIYFHGTNNDLPNIVFKGMDYRLAKLSGSIGIGSYLSKTINYMIRNAENHNCMSFLIVKSVAGIEAPGKPGIRRPPYVSNNVLAHSTTGEVGKEPMWSIFDTYQLFSLYCVEIERKVPIIPPQNVPYAQGNGVPMGGNIHNPLPLGLQPMGFNVVQPQLPNFQGNVPHVQLPPNWMLLFQNWIQQFPNLQGNGALNGPGNMPPQNDGNPQNQGEDNNNQ